MKSSRAWIVWMALGVCAVTVFGAMTWLTRNVLDAGRERAAALHERALAEGRADLEERTRLALWRMDALGAALVLRENRHPVIHYETLTGSPFLTATDPEVLLHFQTQQGGGLTSPELDEHNARESGVAEAIIETRKERMKRLRTLLAANPLPGDEWAQLNCAAEAGETSWNAVPKEAPVEQTSNKLQRETKASGDNRLDAIYQANSNTGEYAQRAKAVAKNFESANASGYQDHEKNARLAKPAAVKQDAAPGQVPASAARITPFGEVVDVGQMRGVWLGGELFLLRQVTKQSPNPWSHGASDINNATKAVQGVWLDSQSLREQLLAEIADLLPQAKLVPAEGEALTRNPLALVSFPFQLDRNETIPATALPVDPSFGAPLRVGWIAVVLAVLTTSLLVRGIMRLSERRASFVSAVTHELRTPLTTFRLYSDMLESGAVKEEKRGHYLRVLSHEADRLSHLVENVLAFSGIERGNARSNVQVVAAGELLERMRERLDARLSTVGLALEMDFPMALSVRADTAAVEHILFNLIDNAAKYAATGDPPVVEIQVQAAGRRVEIIVSDHGPGIPPSERGRIFQAFHKSAREAAESQPGVGLGLALSRRLARAMGGDLKCGHADQGARFVLSLPTG